MNFESTLYAITRRIWSGDDFRVYRTTLALIVPVCELQHLQLLHHY